ncbi:MAG: tetratricopeptide repeat protein, partial [Elusimicrobiota bacterium]
IVNIVQQGEVGVVKHLGEYRRTHEPGLVIIAPFVDSLQRVDMREIPRPGDRQDVITKDNVVVTVNATIFTQIVVAEQALFSILKSQYDQKAFNSILTSYQFIFRHLPPSKSKWRSMSYLYAAEAYLALSQVDEAKVIYEMILKVYPDDPAAFYAQDGLAWSHSYKGEDAEALEARQKLKDMLAVANSSFTFSGLNELGIADSMFNQKNYEDSYQLYAKFAAENPNSPEAPSALYRAAMSSYHQRYYTQAIDLWKKLVAQHPNAKDSPQARAQIADTLFRAQKFAECIAAYREILESEPKGPAAPLAHLRIAQSSVNGKDDAGAVKQVQALVAAFADAPEANDGLDILEAGINHAKLSPVD